MRTPSRYWAIVLAAAALTTAVAAQTGKPKLIPNSVKYSDSGSRPVTGRAGSAVLTGRAFINKDLSTDLELVSSVFGSAAAAGNIAKVQFKPLNNAGSAISVTNWNGLTGGSYFHQNVTGLGHNQHFQIQGNITGIDGARTDVVTLNEVAVMRPDLMVSQVRPSTGQVNVPVSIFATVQELNGDTGAHANCVLYINNTAVDHALGIWVDKGGTVSCMFVYTFTAAGTYNLKVAAENVMPIDYDTSNNSATATITITSPSNLDYTADATDSQINNSLQETETTYNGTLVTFFSSFGMTKQGWAQGSDLTVSKSVSLTFPISSSITESSDGSTNTLSGNFAIPAPDASTYGAPSPCAPPLSPTATCTQSISFYADGWFMLELTLTNVADSIKGNSALFSIELSRNAGDVTFASTSAFCDITSAPGTVCPDNASYFSNSTPDAFGGPRIAFGTQDMFQFAMSDTSGSHYSTNVVIPLTSSTDTSGSQPPSCSDDGLSPSHTTTCSQSSNSNITKQGTAQSPQQ